MIKNTLLEQELRDMLDKHYKEVAKQKSIWNRIKKLLGVK
jgi:hypothetical protein